MTRLLLIPVVTLLLVFTSCNKNNSKSSALTDSTNLVPDTTSLVQGNGKKGADFSTNTIYGTWNSDVVKLMPFWFYTWGTPIPTPTPQNCEFVSMFWGTGNVTSGNISAVETLKAQGKVKYILGFNEPNRTDQSNMTVSQALALWPQLESIGLPLGSPAADWPTRQWIYDFLDSCIAENKRVDFICVHMYADTNVNSYLQPLADLYNKYHLPIWITEFAVADWNATTTANNAYSAVSVQSFMKKLLPQLDALPYVQRYSWFSGDPQSPNLWSSALINTSGGLTALGSWYADYQPNLKVSE